MIIFVYSIRKSEKERRKETETHTHTEWDWDSECLREKESSEEELYAGNVYGISMFAFLSLACLSIHRTGLIIFPTLNAVVMQPECFHAKPLLKYFIANETLFDLHWKKEKGKVHCCVFFSPLSENKCWQTVPMQFIFWMNKYKPWSRLI